MKILIPLAVDFSAKGGFRVLAELANHWIKQGHDVFFVVYKGFVNSYFPTNAGFICYNKKGEIIDHRLNHIKGEKLLLGPLHLIWALKKALNNLTADVVLATQSFSAYPVAKSKIRAKKFYYIQAYEPEYYEGPGFKNKIYKIISKNSYKLGLTNIVNSEMYFDYNGIKSDKAVYPGLDFNNFYAKSDVFFNKDKIILGTIGRLEELKGTKYVLEAFKLLKKEFLNMELHIAFGDDEWDNIEGVKLLKPNNDIELGEYYRSIDIYICAGTYQLNAIHYPVIETMASNTSLITTGYYPSREDNSYIVPIKDAIAIKDAVKSIIYDPRIANEKAKKALTEIQQFSWENVSQKMINFFTK